MWKENQREFDAYIDKIDLITILLPKHRSWDLPPAFWLHDHSGTHQLLDIILYEEHAQFCGVQSCIYKGRVII